MQTINSMYDNYDYPIGADNKSAPWNEEIVEYKRYVSVSLSFPITIDGPRDMPDEYIEEIIKDKIYHNFIPEEYDINEISVINDY